MTYADMVAEVAERLNLSSPMAMARIGRHINERYKQVCASVGLQTSVRSTTTASTVIGDRFVVFTGEKLFSVYDPADSPARVLDQVSVDEMRNDGLGSDPPRTYAVYRMGASTVTIQLGNTPATIYTLGADVETSVSTLSGVLIPAFAATYHDILIKGAMATELEKMEKYDMATKQEDAYELRLSELRYFIAKSAYLQLQQAGHSVHRRWVGMV